MLAEQQTERHSDLLYAVFFLQGYKQMKRNAQTINNTILNNVKSIVKKIVSSNTLPFIDILAKDTINKHIKKSNWRNRVFSPAITIFAFLSVVCRKKIILCVNRIL